MLLPRRRGPPRRRRRCCCCCCCCPGSGPSCCLLGSRCRRCGGTSWLAGGGSTRRGGAGWWRCCSRGRSRPRGPGRLGASGSSSCSALRSRGTGTSGRRIASGGPGGSRQWWLPCCAEGRVVSNAVTTVHCHGLETGCVRIIASLLQALLLSL